jgi:hypothetical protein
MAATDANGGPVGWPFSVQAQPSPPASSNVELADQRVGTQLENGLLLQTRDHPLLYAANAFYQLFRWVIFLLGFTFCFSLLAPLLFLVWLVATWVIFWLYIGAAFCTYTFLSLRTPFCALLWSAAHRFPGPLGFFFRFLAGQLCGLRGRRRAGSGSD